MPKGIKDSTIYSEHQVALCELDGFTSFRYSNQVSEIHQQLLDDFMVIDLGEAFVDPVVEEVIQSLLEDEVERFQYVYTSWKVSIEEMEKRIMEVLEK